ncbi:MAG: tetratricopeptide repeat protein, partial [Calditrichaeota bacterium]|nr:tetratricopeptide repeat protein [Calditrichota bacterium]
YQKAVEIDPTSVNALRGLGVSFFELGKFEESASAFEGALEHISRGALKGDTYYRLGNAYRELDQLDQAESAYLESLKSARSSTIKGGANFGLGEIYKKRGNSGQALKYFTAASQDRTWKKPAEYEIDVLKNPGKYSN